MRIHLDTDLGGDTDDACALAMLLGWPGVEVVGITTVADRDGVRAGYVGHCLGLAEREDVPVAAGAGVSLSTLRAADPVTGDERYWPVGIAPRPGSPGAALDLLEESIMAALGRAHQGLPDDLLNFQYDPVACAVAAAWPGAVVEHQHTSTR